MKEIKGKFALAAAWEEQNPGLSAFNEEPEGEGD